MLLGCIGVQGCSSSTPLIVKHPLDPTHEKLLKIGAAYTRFCTAQGKAPAGPADLQPMLAPKGGEDDVWRSSRDGQPFVVCWGVDLRKPLSWAKGVSVLAYENQGAQGSRYVATTFHNVELLSDKEFHEASFPPGHTPGS